MVNGINEVLIGGVILMIQISDNWVAEVIDFYIVVFGVIEVWW